MDSSLITTDVNSGVGSGKREASEWLDMKSRVVVERFRQLSADLERRRIRRYNHHIEEEQKVRKELDELQKDRLRFEREKQLRKRSGVHHSRKPKEHSSQKTTAERSRLPMNETAFGASASLAFDPSVEKYRRRRTRTEPMTYTATRKAKKEDFPDEPRVFPYIDECDVQRFHKLCKSAGESQCKRWGAAWLYAKKEQAAIPNQHKRWNTLMLNVEKEKQRSIAERWGLLVNRRACTAHVTSKMARKSALDSLAGDRKAASLCGDQPHKFKTPEQQGPSSAKKPCSQQPVDFYSKNSPTDAINSMPSIKRLADAEQSKPVMTQIDVNGKAEPVLMPAVRDINNVHTSYKQMQKSDLKEMRDLGSGNEMDSMPKLNVKHKGKTAQSSRSSTGSSKPQTQLNFPHLIDTLLRNKLNKS